MTQQRWRHLTEWPLTVAAMLFLAAYATEVLAELEGPALTTMETIITATWMIFAVDYVVTLALAERRWRWFYHHLFDLAVIALPALRPLRLLRLVTLIRALQGIAGTAFRGRVVTYVVVTTALLIFIASLAILDAERDAPGSLITDFGGALWWAFVTITTVGYGDLYPVTATGRLIAAGVMLGGIALIGVVTATLASWIVENVAKHDEASERDTRREVSELADEVRALRSELARSATSAESERAKSFSASDSAPSAADGY
jgi:voltage-gated potassium channel